MLMQVVLTKRFNPIARVNATVTTLKAALCAEVKLPLVL